MAGLSRRLTGSRTAQRMAVFPEPALRQHRGEFAARALFDRCCKDARMTASALRLRIAATFSNHRFVAAK